MRVIGVMMRRWGAETESMVALSLKALKWRFGRHKVGVSLRETPTLNG